MTGLSVVLVDDEQLARDRLRRMLDGSSDYNVVAEAANGREAIQVVEQFKPDIVLLDIRMPGMDGLETAQHLMGFPRAPGVIFCTAYEEYALSAFDVHAVGYLLKPVRKERLFGALARAQRVSGAQMDALRDGQARTHLRVKTYAGIELIDLNGISHFVADQKYVSGFFEGREIVVDESLKKLEKEFSAQFLRVHRNCLVALNRIEGLSRDHAGKSTIKLGGVKQPLPVSRRHLSQVKKVLKSL